MELIQTDVFEEILLYSLHFGVFVEIVTKRAVEDPIFMRIIFRHLILEAWDASLSRIQDSPNREFFERRINAAFLAAERELERDSGPVSAKSQQTSLRLSIFETAYAEFTDGSTLDNVLSAFILNYNVNAEFQFIDDTKESIYYLGKEWADMYISLNLAYVPRFQSALFLYELLVPSVLCTSEQGNKASKFFISRLVSVAISASLMASDHENSIFLELPLFKSPTEAMKKLSKINLENTRLTIPNRLSNEMKTLFKEVSPSCTTRDLKIAFLSKLGSGGFELFIQISVSITIILTGLGLEFYVGPRLVDYALKNSYDWIWVLAQFMFSFLTSIAIMSQNILGLPFLVLGLWKFGFPETVVCIQKATFVFKDGDISMCLINLANGVGFLLHHSASAYVVVGLATGHFPLNKVVGSLLLPLVIQHWFFPLKYISFFIFAAVELPLEIWWEFEWFSSFQTFVDDEDEVYDIIAPAMAILMLLSHWLFCFALFLKLVRTTGKLSGDKTIPARFCGVKMRVPDQEAHHSQFNALSDRF